MKEEEQKSIVIYKSWKKPLRKLSLEQKGRIFDALLDFPDPPNFEDDQKLEMAWDFMSEAVESNSKKWNERREKRAAAGRKGAEVTNGKRQQNAANPAVNGNVNGNIRAVIKQVKIPYHGSPLYAGTLHTGANGLNTKVFLLSGIEVGWTNRTNEYFPNDGAKLSYFLAGTGTNENKKRVAYRNGSAQDWYLRSPRIINTSANNVWKVADNGSYDYDNCVNSNDIRPALIMPSTTLVDENGSVMV